MFDCTALSVLEICSFESDGTGYKEISDRHPDAPRAENLLDLSDWSTGIVVEEATLKPNRPIDVATAYNGRAVLVLVCLDECADVQLSLRAQQMPSRSIRAGSVFLIDPRERHVLRAATSVRVVCFGIQLKVLDQLIRRSQTAPKMSAASLLDCDEKFFCDETVRSLALSVSSMLDDTTGPNRLVLEQVTYAVAAHLLLRQCAGADAPAWCGGLAPWQLSKAKSLVLADLGRTLQANELAQACGLSSSHFSRAFRRSTGTSPHAWLVDRRIARAKDLMRTTEAKLADIALECGFADQSHLTRVFTRKEGMSPGSWRRYTGPSTVAETSGEMPGADSRYLPLRLAS